MCIEIRGEQNRCCLAEQTPHGIACLDIYMPLSIGRVRRPKLSAQPPHIVWKYSHPTRIFHCSSHAVDIKPPLYALPLTTRSIPLPSSSIHPPSRSIRQTPDFPSTLTFTNPSRLQTRTRPRIIRFKKYQKCRNGAVRIFARSISRCLASWAMASRRCAGVRGAGGGI